MLNIKVKTNPTISIILHGKKSIAFPLKLRTRTRIDIHHSFLSKKKKKVYQKRYPLHSSKRQEKRNKAPTLENWGGGGEKPMEFTLGARGVRQRDSSVNKNTGCFSRGPEFDSQPPYGGLHQL